MTRDEYRSMTEADRMAAAAAALSAVAATQAQAPERAPAGGAPSSPPDWLSGTGNDASFIGAIEALGTAPAYSPGIGAASEFGDMPVHVLRAVPGAGTTLFQAHQDFSLFDRHLTRRLNEIEERLKISTYTALLQTLDAALRHRSQTDQTPGDDAAGLHGRSAAGSGQQSSE